MIKEIDMVDIEGALNSNEVDMSKWVSDIPNSLRKRESLYYQSFTALSAAWHLYIDLGPATVNPAVLNRRITDSAWANNVSFGSVTHPQSCTLTRELAFACIADFKTGGTDFASSALEAVMEIPIGESIFVAGSLLTDPSQPQEPHKVIRIDGNVGKPGLALMVPLAGPMISKPNSDSWRVIEREEYKRQLEDTFSETSLHLSFTNWSDPICTGATGRGRRSTEASLVETLVSVFDRERWIRDLHVLTYLRQGCSQPNHEFFYCHTCNHDLKALSEDPYPGGIVAIKSWEKFLERPAVISHGLWELGG